MSDVTAETFAYYLSESENGWCKIPRRVADDMAKAHEAQSAELSRLRAEVISEPAECYGGCEDPQCPYMHHPLTMRQDRDNLRAELSRLSALVAEWEKAAEPFARKFDIQDEWPDRTTLWIQNGDMIVAHAQVGDFRRLSQLKDTTNADK